MSSMKHTSPSSREWDAPNPPYLGGGGDGGEGGGAGGEEELDDSGRQVEVARHERDLMMP
jgi:hypothetical protein